MDVELNFKELEKNANLIGELETDENGRQFRMVNGIKVFQIEEKTEADIRLNYNINLWRMRKLSGMDNDCLM